MYNLPVYTQDRVTFSNSLPQTLPFRSFFFFLKSGLLVNNVLQFTRHPLVLSLSERAMLVPGSSVPMHTCAHVCAHQPARACVKLIVTQAPLFASLSCWAVWFQSCGGTH